MQSAKTLEVYIGLIHTIDCPFLLSLPSPPSAMLSMLEEHPPSKKGVGETENHQEGLWVTVNLNRQQQYQ